MNLTKRAVDAAAAHGREKFLWDDAVPGFGLRIHRSGTKGFTFQYRRHGRTRRVAIGLYGVWTVEQARTRVRELRAAVDRGGDPSADRSRAREITFAELGNLYLERHARRFKKDKSVEEDERNLRLHLLPAFGKRCVADVTRADVEKLHARLGRRPVVANRVLALLSMMMNLAEQWGIREPNTNPVGAVKRYREKRRERFLSSEELRLVAGALSTAEKDGTVAGVIVAALRLLILTGARTAEVINLRWSDVDLERRCLRLPDSKTGAKVIPLNAPALKLIEAQARNSEWVFPSPRVSDQPLDNVRRAWRRIRSHAGLSDVRVHDLRHSFASVLAGGGESLLVIGAVLGHKSPQTTARYAHLADDPKQRAVERAGERIVAAMAPKEHPGEVVELADAKAKRPRRNATTRVSGVKQGGRT